MNATLPLFQDLPLRQESERGGGARGKDAGDKDAGDKHLRAAWRLSRSMWRFPDHSPEQTRAGLAICRHLQALLAEAEHEAGR